MAKNGRVFAHFAACLFLMCAIRVSTCSEEMSVGMALQAAAQCSAFFYTVLTSILCWRSWHFVGGDTYFFSLKKTQLCLFGTLQSYSFVSAEYTQLILQTRIHFFLAF